MSQDERKTPPLSREDERQVRQELFDRLAPFFFKAHPRVQRTWLALLVGMLPLDAIKVLGIRLDKKE